MAERAHRLRNRASGFRAYVLYDNMPEKQEGPMRNTLVLGGIAASALVAAAAAMGGIPL